MSSQKELKDLQGAEGYEVSIFNQEFTEQDVLPFLLQAQDIISRLESRVVELEKDLSTIHCKYEYDKNEWLIGLLQKNQYINQLSSKFSKIEFNSKEAIVLLSDLKTNDPQVNSIVRLCLQYLRQAQNIQADDSEQGEMKRRQEAVAKWSQHRIPEHSSIHIKEQVDIIDCLSFVYSQTTSSDHTHYIHSENNTCCMNCKQLLVQLDDQIEQRAYLKRDVDALAAALSEQEEIRSTIEQDKEALEEDVAEITSSLFSVLNQILMDDVTERDSQWTSVLDYWDTRELRLKGIKELLVQLDSAVHQSANISPTFARRFSENQTSPIPSLNKGITFHRPQPNNTVQIDGYILSEFQHHLKTVTETQSSIPSTPFVKRVFKEDIEPCLFFQQSQGWWKSSWFKKKLLDAISKNKCEIQYWNGTCHTSYMSTTTNSSSSLTSVTSYLSACSSGGSPPNTKCVCCNILRVCEFRMRLLPSNNLWLPIDRFCRDRVIAVCGYYNFMNNLKTLSKTITLLSAFKQIMLHRRRMSLSRVGSISLFEDLDDLDAKKLRKNSYCSREKLVLDHSGNSSDSGSVLSISELQGLEGASQIIIVH